MHASSETPDDIHHATGIPWTEVEYDEKLKRTTIRFRNRDNTPPISLVQDAVTALFNITCNADGPITPHNGVSTHTPKYAYQKRFTVTYNNTHGTYTITESHEDHTQDNQVTVWANVLSRVFSWIAHTQFNDPKANEFFYKHIPIKPITRAKLPYLYWKSPDNTANHIIQGGAGICNITGVGTPPNPAELTAIEPLSDTELHNLITDPETCDRCRHRAQNNGTHGISI